ncbi:MAG TPA: hypothetical protein VIO61_06445 [Anaerolineaceae bacterium]
MQKTLSLILLFILIPLTCAACITVKVELPTDQPAGTAVPVAAVPTRVPASSTPQASNTLTPVTPTKPQPMDTPMPTLTQSPVPLPTAPGTVTTYRQLTVTIPQSIAKGASSRDFQRLDNPNAAWWQKTPGHLQVSLADYYILKGKTHQPAIYIYPASEYGLMVPAAFESIHRLNNYLYAPNNVPALNQLPNVPFINAKLLFAAHIQQVSFQNGSGVRFLAEYGQSPISANNTDLFYNYIGITRDGAWYVVAIFPVTSPVLAETPDAGAPLPTRGIPYPFAANPKANMDAYYIAITDLLNVQLPASFSPSLADLDILIQSIRIEP